MSVPPGGGAIGSEGRGAPATGGKGDASIGPEGTASTGGTSTMGAALAPRIGEPPRRVEEQAPSARAEHSTAPVNRRDLVIVVLEFMPPLRTVARIGLKLLGGI